MSHSLAMALWATTVFFSFSRNLVCNLPTQKERRKKNPQQTSHNPKRGFQIFQPLPFIQSRVNLSLQLPCKNFCLFPPLGALCSM